MKAIMIMFDTLNRHYLSPYGADEVNTPNFNRLANKSVVFDHFYVGSMPCMPARRELHTGRYNFLHRSWGPLEPFDDSMPEILRENGVYTHIITDHQHYWEDGGATYHTRYSSFEFVRGQEGDPWKGEVRDPERTDTVDGREGPLTRQDKINRKYITNHEEFPQSQTFAKGLEFIHKNSKEDNWFLQIETFDPHEPFYTPQGYKDLYPHNYDGPQFDWPPYREVRETEHEIEHCRYEYKALISMCDYHLGKIMDSMDRLNLWEDTMLIVNTDHGFLLGEHDWWGKMVMPLYNEIAHPPLFIWDPRYGKKGERRTSLVQIIDLAPTLLDFFHTAVPKDMRGKLLNETIASDTPVRTAALFGIHGGHVNCTDGRYVYMRAPVSPDNEPLYNYTLMPNHMRNRFTKEELNDLQLAPPFSFTKECKILKINANPQVNYHKFGTLLFDIENDPMQRKPIVDNNIENYMVKQMIDLMKETDSPNEQYRRLGLNEPQ